MWQQHRESKAASRVALHLQLINDFESDPMSLVRSNVAGALLRGQSPMPDQIESILDRLESIAYYARRNMLDHELVWHDFSYYVRCYWYKLNDYAQRQREIRKDVTLFDQIESLYGDLLKEEAKRRGLAIAAAPVTDVELHAFLRSEASLRDQVPLPAGGQ